MIPASPKNSDTFMDVRKNAARNWKYSKSYYQVTFIRRTSPSVHFLYFQGQFLKEKATFPTPFQWIYYVAYFVPQCKIRPRKVESQKERSRGYLKLLKRLIEIEQHNKLESTEEDKLADLRKDMKLDLEQMIIAMSKKSDEEGLRGKMR